MSKQNNKTRDKIINFANMLAMNDEISAEDYDKICKVLIKGNETVEIKVLSDKHEDPREKRLKEYLKDSVNSWNTKQELPDDQTIIKQCLNYASHRIKEHNKFIPQWLDRINELRKDDYESLKPNLSQNKIDIIDENTFYKQTTDVQLDILLQNINNIIKHLNQ